MNAKPSFVLSVLVASLATVSTPTAHGADFGDSLSRAEVKAALADARARGELMPAGERPFAFPASRSIGSRADVKAGVLQASAHGELMPAGDRPMAFATAQSTRARAEVKDEVMQAKANSGLMPAGERIASFEPASYPARTQRQRSDMTAAARR